MPKVPRPVLKEYFQSGDKPTGPQFSTMLDSMVNFVDDRNFIGLREYNPALDYLPGDCAVFNDQVVRCITATTGTFNPAHWTVLAAFGSVTYMGTWDTQANDPVLQSSVGTQGIYYVVINASPDPNDNTTLNGTNDWVTGDWAIFNGSIWERVDYSQAPYAAQNVSFVPTVDITSTNVQDAIEEVYTDLTTAVNGLTTGLNAKADKIVPAVTGNFAGLAADGNLIDSTKSAADFLPSTTQAVNIPFTPSGNISATNVQAAIAELDAEKQQAFALTPNFYPYANGTNTLADGVISNESDGVALSAGKVLRSFAPNQAQIDFGAVGNELRLTTDGPVASTSKLLMTPVTANLSSDTIDVAVNGGNTSLHMNGADILLCNDGGTGTDGKLEINSSRVSMYKGTYGGITVTPNADLLGRTTIFGGANSILITNTALSLTNNSGGESISLSPAGTIDLYAPTSVVVNSTLQVSTLAASTVPVVNASQNLVSSAVTPTELGYLSGTTSAVQSQMDSKLPLAGGTMTGSLVLNADPVVALEAVTKQYADAALALKLNLAGGTMSGALILNADPSAALGAATKQYTDAGDAGLQTQVNAKVSKSGDTMTGALILNADPTAALGATTKQYTDAGLNTKLNLSGGTMTGNLVLNTDPSVALGAATKQYVDASIPNIDKKALVPFTFNGAYATSSGTYSRIPLEIVFPEAQDLYPGTTSVTAYLYIDYRITDAATTGKIALSEWSFSDGLIGTPIEETVLNPTDSVWTKQLIGPFALPTSRTLTLVILRDPGAGQLQVEAATLLLTYS